MIEDLVLATLFTSVMTVVLSVALLVRSGKADPAALERALREELRLGREEAARAARELREETAGSSAAAREEASRAISGVRCATGVSIPATISAGRSVLSSVPVMTSNSINPAIRLFPFPKFNCTVTVSYTHLTLPTNREV